MTDDKEWKKYCEERKNVAKELNETYWMKIADRSKEAQQ